MAQCRYRFRHGIGSQDRLQRRELQMISEKSKVADFSEISAQHCDPQ